MSHGFTVFDRALSLERAGGSAELANELFGMLCAELPNYSDTIRAAVIKRDFATVRDTAHRIKGSATYCGVPALGYVAETIETEIKRGETINVESQVLHLLVEIDRVLALPPAPHG